MIANSVAMRTGFHHLSKCSAFTKPVIQRISLNFEKISRDCLTKLRCAIQVAWLDKAVEEEPVIAIKIIYLFLDLFSIISCSETLQIGCSFFYY
jgi:hypothetical protein